MAMTRDELPNPGLPRPVRRRRDFVLTSLPRELTPPTAVTHCVNLSFTGPKASNLVVAKTSLLQIFDTKVVNVQSRTGIRRGSQGVPHPNGESNGYLHRTEPTTKLVLVGQYNLSGTVTSLAKVKALNAKSGGDALIIATKDAKLSLVEWASETHSLATISLHYYEREDLQGSAWAPNLSQCVSYLTVDPSSRCAALKFGVRNLAILPFRQAGDDLVEGDYDPDLDEQPPSPTRERKQEISEGERDQTPYGASFVLPLTALDPSLTHPIHITFLHEYREPTFGIVSSTQAPSSALLPERPDPVVYSVFTLDLEQRASTTLLSVTDLPYDIFRAIALPPPVGGCLLLGANGVVHVDQAGKTNAVGVNEFAKRCSSFSMLDQSDLRLRLEGCVVEQLSHESTDMLIILNDGSLAILSFKSDGRTVSGLSIARVSPENGGLVLSAPPSCASLLGRGKIFVGSEESDSFMLGLTRKTSLLSRKRSVADMLGEDGDGSLDEEDLDDLDDDLYGAAPAIARRTSSIGIPEDYTFRIHDRLVNIAPLRSITFGSYSPSGLNKEIIAPGAEQRVQLIAASGSGRSGALSILNREIDPKVTNHTYAPSNQGLWTIRVRTPEPKDFRSHPPRDTTEEAFEEESNFDQYVIASPSMPNGGDESAIYTITPDGLQEKTGSDFTVDEGPTVEVGTLAGGTVVAQALRTQIRIYNADLGLSQIFPISDEDIDEERTIVSASIVDPYVAIVRDDSSIVVLQTDGNGEIDEIEKGDALLATTWLSASIYRGKGNDGQALLYLLSAEGGLYVFRIPDLKNPVYVAPSLSFLPPFLTPEFVPRRGAVKETLTELLVADLGDLNSASPHLIVRSATDELSIYVPYHHPRLGPEQPFTSNLRWLKVPTSTISKYSEDFSEQNEYVRRNFPLRAVENINGYSTVFLPGSSPTFILKEASSLPRAVNLGSKAVTGFSGFHTEWCKNGFTYVDVDGVLSMCQLPLEAEYGTIGWAVRKIPIGQEASALCYHAKSGLYAIGTSEKTEFKLLEDEFHHEWAREDTSFLPQVDRGMIKILSPKTWRVIDTVELDPAEVVISMRTVVLEISEHTHARAPLLAIGTALVRGEDLPALGRIYIFDIVPVVPDPDVPESNLKLKLIAKEEVKGAVTAVSEIGDQGFLLVAQGQKILVRGLKEDGTFPPVAFMDVQCYVSDMKALKGTGMFVVGDAVKGVWFAGFSVEPPNPKMALFGRSRSRMEVMATEFLPYDDKLYIIAADADSNIHVLQFDPEHPKSLSGQRLLHIAAFHSGQFPATFTLLRAAIPPPTPLASEEGSPAQMPPYQVLHTTATGSLALLTPLSEPSYRRLSTLQNQLINVLDHPAGLNPRSYRAVEGEGVIGGFAGIGGGVGGRGIVDGNVLRRIWELGSWKREEVVRRVDGGDGELMTDLVAVMGGGLGFL